MWKEVLVVVLLTGRIYGQDEEEKDLRTGKELEVESVKESDNEKWHAVGYQQDPEDWIPSQPTEEEPIMKRRRPGRKRKRRPQTQLEREFYTEDDRGSDRDNEEDRLPSRSRPRRPQRLDTRRDNWRDEMMAEEPFRPVRNYNRRRLYPKFDEESTETIEHIRDPYTALNQEQNTSRRRPNRRKPTEETVTEIVTDRADISSQPTDLKSLLKQSGGISLSELLQQRNLSLADLLKGEHQAISALTNIPDTTEAYENVKPTNRRRLPPVTRKYKPVEVREPQRYEIEDSATERRIFVPSHPKYYTSVDYKPNMKDLNIDKSTTSISITTTPLPVTETEQTSESISIISSTVTFSTSENPNPKPKSKPRSRLPQTYAKLKNMATKITTKVNSNTENYPKPTLPEKAIKININELFGVSKLLTTPTTVLTTKLTPTEGPMKISFDQIFQKSVQNENTLPQNETIEKPKEPTAKDEIMEIISDSVSRENLTRLLELRNMTLEELVEQRERGSSQRHLADIFHNKTKEPEPSDETIVDQIIKTNENNSEASIFDTFPKFNKNPKNTIPNPVKDSHYYSIETKRESRENQFGSNEDYNLINNYGSGKLLPIWKQAYTNGRMLPDKYLEEDLIIKDDAQRIEDIENKLAEAVNDALNVDIVDKTYYDDDDNSFLRLPYGVRSAIVASAVIIGISLLVFLTIFIIFKWTQRQKCTTNYANSFSSSKIRTPILETPYQRRIFGNIMNATLGRKKKIPTISCSEPQSLQEYLWETDRKPFQ